MISQNMKANLGSQNSWNGISADYLLQSPAQGIAPVPRWVFKISSNGDF